jgi:hypothetical protein
MEVRMRILSMVLVAFALCLATAPDARVQAQGSECTGANCPPPSGTGGHGCDHEKKEETVS